MLDNLSSLCCCNLFIIELHASNVDRFSIDFSQYLNDTKLNSTEIIVWYLKLDTLQLEKVNVSEYCYILSKFRIVRTSQDLIRSTAETTDSCIDYINVKKPNQIKINH